MMNRKPTPQLKRKDLELISAYLDGQLSEAERSQLRQRLSQDATFKQVYDDLRLTRMALRSAPQIKRRRSFTLTPEMVGKPTRVFGLQTASRLVAVVATVLLVAVFAGDVFLLPKSGTQLSLLRSAANDAVVFENIGNDLEVSEPMGGGAPPLALEQAVEEGEADEAAAEAAPVEAPSEPAVEDGAAADTAETERVGDTDSGDDSTMDGAGFTAELPPVTPSGTPAPKGTQGPEEEPVETIIESETIVEDGEMAVDDAAEDQPMAMAEPSDVEQVRTYGEYEEPFPVVTAIELGLLALALISGAVALLTRRRVR